MVLRSTSFTIDEFSDYIVSGRFLLTCFLTLASICQRHVQRDSEMGLFFRMFESDTITNDFASAFSLAGAQMKIAYFRLAWFRFERV